MCMDSIPQVKDDLDLLELMVSDSSSADSLFKTTNYWLNYQNVFLPELRSLGLRDFRRRRNSILYSFGAVDFAPLSFPLDNSIKGIYLKLARFNFKTTIKLKKFLGRIKSDDVNLFLYEMAKSYGLKCGAQPLDNLEASLVGNPESYFSVDGKIRTYLLLTYYVQYAYCCRFMNFNKINSMMEIGSGCGKQIEVIKKLHPHITFYIFDIPPQLYVCEQYLSAIFPDSVVSYRETRNMTRIPEEKAGKIFIFNNWKLPQITNLDYDLFWNSTSFQEMEPEVVANYLKYVNQQAKKYVFLHETMAGLGITKHPGEQGVFNKTVLDDYKKGLNNFMLKDLSIANHLPTLTRLIPHRFGFWEKS